MSKLAEKMRRAGRGGTTPIGFGAGTAATKLAPLLLVARLSPEDPQGAAAAVAAGADVLIFADHLPNPEVKAALTEGTEMPWGLLSGTTSLPPVEAMKEVGADFVIISAADAPAAWLAAEDGPGWVLSVSLAWEDSLLRAADGLSLDALYLTEALTPAQLTVERAIQLRRVSQLAQRPLLVPLAESWDSAPLQALVAAGVLGVVVEGEESLKGLRPILDQLPRLGQRPRGHMEAVLPRPETTSASGTPREEKE